MAGGKKESSHMDHKIGGAMVAGVLKLENVLELVDDGLGGGSFARPVACRTVHLHCIMLSTSTSSVGKCIPVLYRGAPTSYRSNIRSSRRSLRKPGIMGTMGSDYIGLSL